MKKESRGYSLHNAFTLLELVFVIVVVGILAAVVVPKSDTNRLREAALQVVSHIRYTQHLAMTDDRFDTTDSTWYKTMWQIRFTDGIEPLSGKVAYGVFSDTDKNQAPTAGGNVAVEPLSGLLLTGGVTNALPYDDPNNRIYKKANLGMTYGVIGLDFGSECTKSGSRRIAFDHLGRPIKGTISIPESTASTYLDVLNLITGTCVITLCTVEDCDLATNDEKVEISIEPETGYAYIND